LPYSPFYTNFAEKCNATIVAKSVKDDMDLVNHNGIYEVVELCIFVVLHYCDGESRADKTFTQ